MSEEFREPVVRNCFTGIQEEREEVTLFNSPYGGYDGEDSSDLEHEALSPRMRREIEAKCYYIDSLVAGLIEDCDDLILLLKLNDITGDLSTYATNYRDSLENAFDQFPDIDTISKMLDEN